MKNLISGPRSSVGMLVWYEHAANISKIIVVNNDWVVEPRGPKTVAKLKKLEILISRYHFH